MKKLVLCLSAAAALCGVFGHPAAARADVGPYDDGDYGYDDRPRYRHHREYREENVYEGCRPRRVYVVERGCRRPVRRDVYFDPYGRCFYPVGPRRVYVETYHHEYPRFYRPRPNVGLSFTFGG